jgi:hypothetical protein
MSEQTFGWPTSVATVVVFPFFAIPAGILAAIESRNPELLHAGRETEVVAQSAETDAQAALVTIGCAVGFRLFNLAVTVASLGTASRPEEAPA